MDTSGAETRLATDLLALAIAEPDQAEAWADRVIASSNEPVEQSVAHQARAIVLRDRGFPDLAFDELRIAIRLARQGADADREADVRATLGVTLAVAGRTRAGLDQLHMAVSSAMDPTLLAKILVRRGHVMYFFLARPHDALTDLDRALGTFRKVDEPVWLARTLNLVGLAHLAAGRTDAAAQAIHEAESIFLSEGQVAESLVSLHNRGFVAFCSGDLPESLRLYDDAARGHVAENVDTAGLVFDYGRALLAAGLASEASELIVARLEQGHLADAQRAELLLQQATAELAADDEAASQASASAARALFRRQRRNFFAMRAELAVLLAQQRAGRGGRRLVDTASSVAQQLEERAPEEAAVAWLLAGRMALGARLPEAPVLLDHAAAYRTNSSDLVRATGWQARALRREAEDDRRGALAACRRGLDALDSHRATLGSSELRALATRHGDELSALALRHAVHCGPRVLLEWSERWRATALSQPPVHPPDDQELAQSLAALRDTRRRLAEARAEGAPTAARLDEDRIRLERAIRHRTHYLSGTAIETTRFGADRLVSSLDGATFVELVDIDGVLHALVARSGRVHHVVVGDIGEAEAAVAFARFALRQTARGRPSDLADVGRRLQSTLLGDAVRRLGDGPVVVSPPGRLHATPWALLPALAGVPVSVAPSAALWLRARSIEPVEGQRVLIVGPGLASGWGEVPTLAARYPEAALLAGRTATVEDSLTAMDGAALVHISAHGRFREDSPMFSSLDLDDGPLTVHDFERLNRAPHRMVLSACESGVMAPIGAGEMLGLVAAMLSMGSAGVVSSVAQVNDEATADLMLDVHAALDDGDDLGRALLRARDAARGDRVHEATAAAFLAMGV